MGREESERLCLQLDDKGNLYTYDVYILCNIFHCETTRTERGVIGAARESNGDFAWIW